MQKSGKHSPFRSLFLQFKKLFRKLLDKTHLHSPQVLPLPMTEDPDRASWDKRDVMIGTVRSEEQLQYNLKEHCYYVPGKFLPRERLPLSYIALFDWDEEGQPAIRLWSRVLTHKELPRGEIPVAMRPYTEATERYDYFTVEPWRKLPHRLSIGDIQRGKPLFTRSFLLEHCQNAWELFLPDSPESYRLLVAMRMLLDQADRPCGYALSPSRALLLQKNRLILTDNHGKPLGSVPLTLCNSDPRSAYLCLKPLLSREQGASRTERTSL